MASSESAVSCFETNFQSSPQVVATAPGRVEVIGNHTDYNQGPVIGAAIDRNVTVALSRIADTVFRFASSEYPFVEVNDSSLKQSGENAWVNYPLGVYNALIRRGLKPSGGFQIAVESNVPSGAGLSSSAALELASAKAIASAFDLELSDKEFAIACREAENDFVGVPCGILDQGVSAFGQAGQLVHIDCRELVFSTFPLGSAYSIWIFNTHKKHSLVESMYATRHKECFEAVDQLRAAGLEVSYLADVNPDQFEAHKSRLSEDVAKRAEHVIYEIERVNQVDSLLAEGQVGQVGELLFASHESSSKLFENSIEELDYLVSILKSMPDVVGARLTGGGFGGAAMALAGEAFTDSYAQSVASAYRGRFGDEPDILHCHISDGARLLSSN